MRCALVAVVVVAAARAADASNPLEAGQRGQWWLKNHPSKQDDAPSIGLHQTVKKGGKAAKEKKEKASKEVPTSDVRYDNMPESKAKKPNSNQHSLLATAPADGSTAKHDARVAAKAAKDAAAEAKMLADEAAKEMDEAKRAYAEAESAASQWKAQQTTPTEQPQQQEIGPDSTMASSSAEQPQQQADTVPPQQQQEPQQQEQPLQQAVAVPQQQQQQQQQAEKQLSQNKANEADEADEADVAPAEGSSDDTSETEEMVAASAAMAAKVTRESTKAEAMTNAEAVTIDLDKSQQAQGSPAAAQNVTDQNATGVESRNLVKLVGDSILAIKGALNYSSGQRRYIEREMNLLNDAEALLALARSELPGLDGDSLLPPVATALVSTPATPDEKNEYAQAKMAEAVVLSSSLVVGLPVQGTSEQFRHSAQSFQEKCEKVQVRFARVLKQRAEEAKKKTDLKQTDSAATPVLDLDKDSAATPVLDLDKDIKPAATAAPAEATPTAAKPGFHPVALPSVTSSPHKAAYHLFSRLFASEMEMQGHAAESAHVSDRMAMFFSP